MEYKNKALSKPGAFSEGFATDKPELIPYRKKSTIYCTFIVLAWCLVGTTNNINAGELLKQQRSSADASAHTHVVGPSPSLLVLQCECGQVKAHEGPCGSRRIKINRPPDEAVPPVVPDPLPKKKNCYCSRHENSLYAGPCGAAQEIVIGALQAYQGHNPIPALAVRSIVSRQCIDGDDDWVSDFQ